LIGVRVQKQKGGSGRFKKFFKCGERGGKKEGYEGSVEKGGEGGQNFYIQPRRRQKKGEGLWMPKSRSRLLIFVHSLQRERKENWRRDSQ